MDSDTVTRGELSVYVAAFNVVLCRYTHSAVVPRFFCWYTAKHWQLIKGKWTSQCGALNDYLWPRL